MAHHTTLSDNYTESLMIWRHRWTDKLFSFRLERPPTFRFTPGQFVRIGLNVSTTNIIWRAYSMCSASTDEYLEFYSILVPDGAFSPRLAQVQPGASVLMEKKAIGFFTADRLPSGYDIWLLATGTGLAPYLSILQDPDLWQRFDKIILVHGVRYPAELTYQDFIAALRTHPLLTEQGHKLHYLQVVTREHIHGALHQRMPQLLADGELFQMADLYPTPEQSRFMICGSPQMVHDTYKQLMSMGYKLSRLSAPAQIVLENAW